MEQVYYLVRTFGVAAALLTAVFFQPEVIAAANDEDLVIDDSIQAKLAPLLKEYKPIKPLSSAAELREIDNKGNLGRLRYYERKVTYAPLQSGLWAIHGIGGFTSSNSRGTSQILSLCGLVNLLSATAGKVDMDGTAVIPFGRIFLPFAIKSSRDYGRKSRVKDFEASTPDICRPSPGLEFSIRLESELTVSMGRTSVSTVSDQLSCKVAAEAKSVDGFLPGVMGEGLPTACERKTNGGSKAALEYVFLPDAGFYVLLRESSDIETTKVQYKEVTVAQ
jgi:hypothetical protein